MGTATYNRIYSTMFDGSLWGSGPLKIACWAYVLAEMKPDFGKAEFYVELNPDKLAAAIGVKDRQDIIDTISEFCEPDGQSRTDVHEGRRLLKQGQFTYMVVNGSVYNDIKRREVRREQNRLAQQRYRKKGHPLPGEALAAKALDQNHEDKITSVALPEDNEPQWMSQYKEAVLKGRDDNDDNDDTVE